MTAQRFIGLQRRLVGLKAARHRARPCNKVNIGVLRSLLTAGVLASGLFWSLRWNYYANAAGVGSTLDGRSVIRMLPVTGQCKPDTEGMHGGKHTGAISEQ